MGGYDVAKQGKRKIKSGVVNQMEDMFDLKRLDYESRTKPIRNRSKLAGALGALLVYGTGFGGGYLGWQNGLIAYAVFAKLVWILMIPATVIGMFIWLLAANRREYAVRQDVRDYIRELEDGTGLLWRFSPILSELKPDDLVCKEMMTASSQGDLDKMQPEDYAKAVLNLYHHINASSNRRISPETAAVFARNLK